MIDMRFLSWPWALPLVVIVPLLTAWMIAKARRMRAKRLAHLGTPLMIARLAPTAAATSRWQPVRLTLADQLAQRRRVLVPEIVRGDGAAPGQQLADLHHVRGLLVGQARHRRHQLGPIRIAAHQRQRRLRRLALAVQVVRVDRVQVGHRDLDPARVARDQR